MALNKTSNINITKKNLIFNILTIVVAIIILITLITVNKRGLNVLKPSFIYTIIALTILFICITYNSYIKGNDKIFKISYQVYDILSLVVMAITVIQIVFTFIAFPAQVVQTSMYPTLEDTQHVLCYSNTMEIKRFDIVVVMIDDELERETNGILSSGELIVKRVVGLPGEEIEYIDNKLYVNDKLVNEDFLSDDVSTGNVKRIILKDDEYLLLGDHRSASIINGSYKPGSYDCRDFGAVNHDNIIGIVKYKMENILNWIKVE